MKTCSLDDLIDHLVSVRTRYGGQLQVVALLQDADSLKQHSYLLQSIGVTGDQMQATSCILNLDPCSKMVQNIGGFN